MERPIRTNLLVIFYGEMGPFGVFLTVRFWHLSHTFWGKSVGVLERWKMFETKSTLKRKSDQGESERDWETMRHKQ